MLSTFPFLALAFTTAAVPVSASRGPLAPQAVGAALEDGAPAHLAVSLRERDAEGLKALLRDQQDPASPRYHAWLTPTEFGERFGQPAAVYARIVAWAEGAGFQVTPSANRIFLEATGTVAEVRALLGVQLHWVRVEGADFRSFVGTATAPAEIAQAILTIQGLDTRPRFKHRLTLGQGFNSFGPQDLRRFYDIQPLLDQGYTGRGAQLAVLGSAAPSNGLPQAQDVAYFYGNASDTAALFLTRTLPNPNNDLDPQPGVRQELEMDVELQTVAAPGAASVTLDLPPSSEMFTTGINDIATNLAQVSAVSTSFGSCELQSGLSTQDAAAAEQLVAQGTSEGQSWFSAAGDNGADDCQDGVDVSVDFPSDIPEMVAVGGTQVTPVWDSNGASTAYVQEQVWNLGAQGGAGGGGASQLFTKPGWQVTTTPADGARDLPDLALLSAPNPGVICDNSRPGELSPNGGTSDAAPLSAGIFALLGDRLGGRLGGVNPLLYALGHAQFHGGGPAVFHDITQGNISYNGVSGPSAGPGFDLATGWGSLDVAALARAWPVAVTVTDAGTATDGGNPADAGRATDGGGVSDGGARADAGVSPDAGSIARIPYNPCAVLDCTGGATCDTVPEGPSGCTLLCSPTATTGCPSGEICGGQVGDAGSCVPGCLKNADCATGESCFTCSRTCYPVGNVAAHVGDACHGSGDCPAGAFCLPERYGFTGGYCTFPCDPQACACPANNSCEPIDNQGDFLCFAGCDPATSTSCRSGYACQAQGAGQSVCLPRCQSDQDCQQGGSSTAVTCNLSTGQCVGPAIPDAGISVHPDAGALGAGSRDAGATDAGHAEKPTSHGCGCSGLPGEADGGSLALIAFALALGVRRPRGLRPSAGEAVLLRGRRRQ